MDIRILAAEDALVYRELRLRALSLNPEAFSTIYDDYVERPFEQIAAQLAPTDHHFTLGAFNDTGDLVGVVTLVRERAPKVRHTASLVGMFVAPEARRRGIARALVADLIGRAGNLAGVERIKLSVVKGNDAAAALYRLLGFQTYGVEPDALKSRNRYWDELHMVLSIAGEDEGRIERGALQGKGFSHVTIDVSSLEKSLDFYVGALGMQLVHRGRRDAYLEWGTAWVCLQERPELPPQNPQLGVDHVAFYIGAGEFHAAGEGLRRADVHMVRGPVERGGGWTVNFLDPDGTQLELHTGTLAERMKLRDSLLDPLQPLSGFDSTTRDDVAGGSPCS